MSMLLDLLKRKKKTPDAEKHSESAGKAAPLRTVIHTCEKCSGQLMEVEWEKKLKVCPNCGFHTRLSARERVAQVLDAGSFSEKNSGITAADPLQFPEYGEKLQIARDKSGEKESVLTGTGTIYGTPVALFCMDPAFMMGSLGSATGEKITSVIETAIEKKHPVVGFCASGGARMQEGILSLMQMAKTSAVLAKLGENGLPYIAVLTDPTTGGVTASFAMLGDVILSEPNALIGFAGQRVIEQTIRQSLPEGFQRAEFQLEKGFLDRIVPREDMKNTLSRLLFLHGFGEGKTDGDITGI